MTLERASDILTQHITRAWPANDPDLRAAIKLGIEALKMYKQAREGRYLYRLPPLPGETQK